jgi:hypothetical protein
MSGLLGEARDDRQRAAAASEIVTWGGLPALQPEVLQRVLDSLELLDRLAASGEQPQGAIYAGRIAAVSKIYAMHAPSDWVIYDSRVARGLAMLVRQQFGSVQVPADLCFPQPQGRTGIRPEGFPALGTEKQARLAFVYASWIAQALALGIQAPCPAPGGWDTRHVEMALFMLGQATDGALSRRVPAPIGTLVERIDTRLVALRHEIEQLSAVRTALTDPGPDRSRWH